MGSVKVLTTTGDNDPEIFPVDYYRYYMYCDNCGSFQLRSWIESDFDSPIARRQQWINKISKISLISAIASAVFGIICLISNLIFMGKIALDWWVLVWFGISVIIFLIFTSLDSFDDLIQTEVVGCGACGQEYERGSAFFADLEQNPRNFSMKDVPLPLNKTYWIRGKENDG